MLTVHLSTEPNGNVCMAFAYNKEFIDKLKLWIPWQGRTWDASRKRWIVGANYGEDLQAFLEAQGCRILDNRMNGTTPPATAPAVAPAPPMPDNLRQAFDGLYLAYTAPLCVAEASYKALARYYHPDHGGDTQDFYRVTDAIAIIRSYLDPQPGDPDDAIPF